MLKTIAIALYYFLIFLSVAIIICNAFTVFVFWIHRKELNRTSLLLINLAVADLLVGIAAIVAAATFALPRQSKINEQSYGNIASCFQATFSGTSMYFLVLISLERAFAMIWPLHHRITSIKTYVYSVIIVWLAGITAGTMYLLALYGIYEFVYYTVGTSVIAVFSLVMICVSYLSIRARVNNRGPVIDASHNRQSVEQNKKLSKTMFIVIGASIVFWVPSLVLLNTSFLFPKLFPKFVHYISSMLQLTNYLANPIIYSLRMPLFKKMVKRLKNKLRIPKRKLRIPKRFKNYTVNDDA